MYRYRTRAKTPSSARRPTASQRIRVVRAGIADAFDAPAPLPAFSSGAEDRAARVLGVGAQGLLDAQQLVVLGHAVRARRRAGLDLAAARGHREVGDRRVLGLARAMRHHRRVARLAGHLDRLERLAERADL